MEVVGVLQLITTKSVSITLKITQRFKLHQKGFEDNPFVFSVAFFASCGCILHPFVNE